MDSQKWWKGWTWAWWYMIPAWPEPCKDVRRVWKRLWRHRHPLRMYWRPKLRDINHLQSYSVDSFATLSKCSNLRHLDLPSVAGTFDLNFFLNSIKNLTKLKCLHFPISFTVKRKKIPERLPSEPINLLVPHNLGSNSLKVMSNFPISLTHLGIGIVPFLTVPLVNLVLQKPGPQLKSLEAKHTRRFIVKYSLDHILRYLPVLRRLSIPAEQMSADFFTCS